MEELFLEDIEGFPTYELFKREFHLFMHYVFCKTMKHFDDDSTLKYQPGCNMINMGILLGGASMARSVVKYSDYSKSGRMITRLEHVTKHGAFPSYKETGQIIINLMSYNVMDITKNTIGNPDWIINEFFLFCGTFETWLDRGELIHNGSLKDNVDEELKPRYYHLKEKEKVVQAEKEAAEKQAEEDVCKKR